VSGKKANWLRPASIGPQFIIALLIGAYFGTKMDEWLQTGRLCTFIGGGLGLAAGFLNLFRELALINKEEEEREREERDSIPKNDEP